MTPAEVLLRDGVQSIAEVWRSERAERLVRRHLEQGDFDALREAGFLLTVVPETAGGLCYSRRWEEDSRRRVCTQPTYRSVREGIRKL